MNEQRVFHVTSVAPLVPADGPHAGLWQVTCTDPHTSEALTLETCQPPEPGAYLFLDVVGVESAAPVGAGF